MDSEGPQFERCKFSILGIEANFDCDFRKWLCKCWIIYFLGGLPTKLVRTVLLWQVFFYFEVSMEMFSVSLKLFTQYLCRKIFQATPFTSHTLQLENRMRMRECCKWSKHRIWNIDRSYHFMEERLVSNLRQYIIVPYWACTDRFHDHFCAPRRFPSCISPLFQSES